MKPKSDKPLSKHTMNLYVGQLSKLRKIYGIYGAALIIRKLINKHLGEIKKSPKSKIVLRPEQIHKV